MSRPQCRDPRFELPIATGKATELARKKTKAKRRNRKEVEVFSIAAASCRPKSLIYAQLEASLGKLGCTTHNTAHHRIRTPHGDTKARPDGRKGQISHFSAVFVLAFQKTGYSTGRLRLDADTYTQPYVPLLVMLGKRVGNCFIHPGISPGEMQSASCGVYLLTLVCLSTEVSIDKTVKSVSSLAFAAWQYAGLDINLLYKTSMANHPAPRIHIQMQNITSAGTSLACVEPCHLPCPFSPPSAGHPSVPHTIKSPTGFLHHALVPKDHLVTPTEKHSLPDSLLKNITYPCRSSPIGASSLFYPTMLNLTRVTKRRPPHVGEHDSVSNPNIYEEEDPSLPHIPENH
ncbi:hypothetical protein QBC36DRAFT_379887 [Triangularia setosa]|uniref:Uncharacterized protein n=1 Tax=Triangularia setosa TaxID=2587417 RepID=A0AAN7A665_9PEZI|nr:hypothetical protein QBC36DRAFT_379887 [Podospora setosa]